jgi:hypothetical protein
VEGGRLISLKRCHQLPTTNPSSNITPPPPTNSIPRIPSIKYEYRKPINLINVLCNRSCIYMLQRDEADYNHTVSPMVLAKKREVRNEGGKGVSLSYN